MHDRYIIHLSYSHMTFFSFIISKGQLTGVTGYAHLTSPSETYTDDDGVTGKYYVYDIYVPKSYINPETKDDSERRRLGDAVPILSTKTAHDHM